jgi:hypothetical protein
MDAELERQVRARASKRCEYCLIPQIADLLPHQIDHIIARKHGGESHIENLALACFHGNNHKGPNIAGVDPESRQMSKLFHPRIDQWSDHLTLGASGEIIGRTAIGRTTVRVLEINDTDSQVLRGLLIVEGMLKAGGLL